MQSMSENDFECFASTGVNAPLTAMKPNCLSDGSLDGLKAFSTTIATTINDLPATSPRGTCSYYDSRNLGLATDPNGERDTAMAHRDAWFELG
jgi:hypothetical protein